MALPDNFFAPSFRQKRLGWLFAVLVGIVVYLASFSTLSEAALSVATYTWNSHASSRLTIEVPPMGDEAATSQAERVKQVEGILHALPGIMHVTRITENETERLLKPWISQPEFLKSLALPTLIDIERAPENTYTAEDIRQRIKSAAPDVRVDDHTAWLADLRRFVEGLAAVGAALIVLTAITLIIVVNLLCHSIMTAERDTLSLLHIMGARDQDIASHFARHAAFLSWRPALAGFVCAILSASGLLYVLRHFADLMAVPALLWAGLGMAVICVPVAAVAIAFFTARLSALNTLYAMP